MPDSTAHKKYSSLTVGILVLVVSLAVYKLIGYLYFLVLSTHYGSYIPTSFEIEENVFAGDRIGGFIEGCGVAVFKLSEKTSASISGGGVTFLNKNSKISNSKHKQYNAWRETPFVFELDEYLVFGHLVNEDAGGNTCVDFPSPLKENILSAINRPGAFYTRFNKNTELLVIPSLTLAVFSHDR